jgi:hypothetical protein
MKERARELLTFDECWFVKARLQWGGQACRSKAPRVALINVGAQIVADSDVCILVTKEQRHAIQVAGTKLRDNCAF